MWFIVCDRGKPQTRSTEVATTKKIPDHSSAPQKWLLQGTTTLPLSPGMWCVEGGEVFCPRSSSDAHGHHNTLISTSGRVAWGGGYTPTITLGCLSGGRTQPEPPGRLSFCPGVRGQSMALGSQSLVAWQQRGLAWPPCWSLAWPPCWDLVDPPRRSRPLRWRRPPSAACRAWVGGCRAWGAAEVSPALALGGREGGRAGGLVSLGTTSLQPRAGRSRERPTPCLVHIFATVGMCGARA